jgi:two-component system OmpR family response regulator
MARLLVVDDEDTVRGLLADEDTVRGLLDDALRFAGFEVGTAATGDEAVRGAARPTIRPT